MQTGKTLELGVNIIQQQQQQQSAMNAPGENEINAALTVWTFDSI